MNILLAEDDPNIKTIALLTLEQVGQHNVTVVDNGTEALELALKGGFDVILLDEMMPGLNGLNVAQKYKESVSQPKPIIFLSAKSQPYDLEQFKKHGTGYITKPFDPTQLNQQIESILTSAAA